jgi:beta-N-acetylhexosaminidase
LFARNLTQDPMQCAELSRSIASAAPAELPPLVSIDQEGGRVARLKAPVLELPPMRTLAKIENQTLIFEAAEALGRQLAALGITMDFAPVLDVNTLASNPIIGDRAFSDDVAAVDYLGGKWAKALERGGVLPCGKHFPGHGHTSVDSHLDLPVDARALAELRSAALPPFRTAAYFEIPALMTAHVLYPSVDPDWPATLSPKVLGLAREWLHYEGCLVSDDLEMKAVADRWSVEESAVRAVAAGCDVLLVCRSEELQARAVEGLARRASEDGAFEARCRDAHDRFVAMKRRVPPQPVMTRAAFDDASALARDVAAMLAAALGAAS